MKISFSCFLPYMPGLEQIHCIVQYIQVSVMTYWKFVKKWNTAEICRGTWPVGFSGPNWAVLMSLLWPPVCCQLGLFRAVPWLQCPMLYVCWWSCTFFLMYIPLSLPTSPSSRTSQTFVTSYWEGILNIELYVSHMCQFTSIQDDI